MEDQKQEIQSSVRDKPRLNIVEVMYYVGAGIAALGIVIMVVQNWSQLSFVSRLLLTIGSGIIIHAVSFLIDHYGSDNRISSALYVFSAIAIFLGMFVFLDNVGFSYRSIDACITASGTMLAIYVMMYMISRKNIFALFGIIFGSVFLFFQLKLITDTYIMSPRAKNISQAFYYRLLIIGAAYLPFAYFTRKSSIAPIGNFLYGMGVVLVLFAANILAGGRYDYNAFWTFACPVLIFGAFFLSAFLKKKYLLVWSSIFLVFYIIRITFEFFRVGMSWPLVLILVGASIIGVSYMSIWIKRKYLA
jgi:hypothetical protein